MSCNFWTMPVNEKLHGEHRELSIIGTQEKDLNIIGGKPFADKATKKQEPKRKRGGLRVKTRSRKSRPFLPVVVLGNDLLGIKLTNCKPVPNISLNTERVQLCVSRRHG